MRRWSERGGGSVDAASSLVRDCCDLCWNDGLHTLVGLTGTEGVALSAAGLEEACALLGVTVLETHVDRCCCYDKRKEERLCDGGGDRRRMRSDGIEYIEPDEPGTALAWILR